MSVPSYLIVNIFFNISNVCNTVDITAFLYSKPLANANGLYATLDISI